MPAVVVVPPLFRSAPKLLGPLLRNVELTTFTVPASTRTAPPSATAPWFPENVQFTNVGVVPALLKVIAPGPEFAVLPTKVQRVAFTEPMEKIAPLKLAEFAENAQSVRFSAANWT